MAQNISILPPIRKSRPKSSAEKGCWNRVLSVQRKMSVDRLSTTTTTGKSSFPASSASSLSNVLESVNGGSNQSKHDKIKHPNESKKGEKKKVCPRLIRSLREDTILEIEKYKNDPDKSVQQQNGDKMVENMINNKQANNDVDVLLINNNSLIGDDPYILEATLLLEKIERFQLNQDNQVEMKHRQQQILQLEDCKHQLQKLLLNKIRSITEHDCLLLVHEGSHYVHKLETIYTEDNYKLTTAKSCAKLTEKQRKLAVNDFVNSSNNRRNLPVESDDKIKGWISNLRNTQRLLNINYRIPKERVCLLLVESTASALNRIRISIGYWLELILKANIAIMTIYWDNLPFECICSVFAGLIVFNRLFASDHRIDPIPMIANIQSKMAAHRITLLIANDVDKFLGNKSLNNTPDLKCKPDCNDDDVADSDYFTETGSSQHSSKPGSSGSPLSEPIDLFNYININSSSGQQIVIKLSFAAQHAITLPHNLVNTFGSNSKSTPINNNHRQTWSKLDAQQSIIQKQLFHSFDSIYWPQYWTNFTSELIYNVIFFNCDSIPSSIWPFNLCSKKVQNLIYDSFKQSSLCCDVNGTTKGLHTISDRLLYEMITSSWLKIHRQFYHNLMDNNRRVYGQYDRLFVETVEKLFIDMVLFTLKEVESESTNGCNKLIVIKQLDYLAKMLEAYVKTLPQTVDLGCLIDFVKQLKTPGRLITSLEISNSLQLSRLIATFDGVVKNLHEKIDQKVYQLTLKAVCERIAITNNNKLKDLHQFSVVDHVHKTFLEPNLEVVKSFSSKKPSKLFFQIIESFSRALLMVLSDKVKLKLSRQLKYFIKRECNHFVDEYEAKFLDTEFGDAFERLKILCKKQKFTNLHDINNLWSRDNRITPADQLWPKSKSSHDLTSVDCGCFW